MGRTSPTRRDLQRTVRFCAAALALSSLGACVVRAQDVAEAARQEKARKAAAAAEQKSDKHVYSNDDLKRAKILTPEEQARVEARKNNPAAPSPNQPAPALDATNSNPNAAPAESLGEVARRYRREKAARESEQALKVPPRSGFPMNLSQPALAAPAPLRSPAVSAAAPALKPTRPAIITAPPVRRDPFSRPSRIQPRPPATSLPPSPAPHTFISAPSKPNSVVLPKNSAPVPAPTLRKPPALAPVPVSPIPLAAIPQPALTVPRAFAAPKVPAPVDVRTGVTIQPGDSLWKLARKHLGKGSRWPEFLAANASLVDPTRIQPGATLLLPHATSAPAHASALAAGSPLRISVQKGDSLWKLAQQHLGHGAYWPCLAQANPHLQDPDHIYPTQSLVIPAACQPAP